MEKNIILIKGYGIHYLSTVIIKRNGKIFPIRIDDVVKGDQIKGYNKKIDKDCFNTVLKVDVIEIPDKDQMVFFYQESNEVRNLICGELTEFDVYDVKDKTLNYKLGRELNNMDKIKGTLNLVEVHSSNVGYVCKENKFIMFHLAGSSNFYVRKEEIPTDLFNKWKSELLEENQDLSKREDQLLDSLEKKHRIGYEDYKFDNFVLVRSLKS